MEYQDYTNNPTGRSPRRELQGPRPTPLRINKDSHKIKKPPLAPSQLPQPSQQPPPRQPIIIYTVSPKVIHTTPGDFMSLVQRLTGSASSSSQNIAVSNHNDDPFNAAGMVSPAARYATIEKARSPMGKKQHQLQHHQIGGGEITISDVVEGVEMNVMMERAALAGSNMFQGILSPGPAALSPIPASFFSPLASDPAGMVSFLHDLSPAVVHHHNSSNRSFSDGSFMMPSPSNFVSPLTPSIDLFNYFLD